MGLLRKRCIGGGADRELIGALLVLLAAVDAGCAHSSRDLYRPTAWYSVKDRAWIAQKDPKQPKWTFHDPISNCVIRCRSDLEKWAAVTASCSRAYNKETGKMSSGFLVTLPLALPGALLVLPWVGVAAALSEPSAKAHRERGDEARKRLALDEATSEYFLALWRGDHAALESIAQIFIEQGRTADALQVRKLLVCTGGLAADSEWNRVESWLKEQGAAVPSCAGEDSRAPLEVPWVD